ncbi:MAG: CHRD domain-containing protein [Rubrobacteraceae bacterium]
MHKRIMLIASMVAVAALVVMSGAAVAKTVVAGIEGGRLLTASLTGANEVPGPGDPDGTGTAVVSVKPSAERLCFELSVDNIAPATAAHVHDGPAGVAGPVVVTLTPPSDGSSEGCVTADKTLLKDIKKNPTEYYVNVHNTEFPAGAVRGQLSR